MEFLRFGRTVYNDTGSQGRTFLSQKTSGSFGAVKNNADTESAGGYLALINRAGGLYGRILTEVVSTDRGQDSPIQTNLARLIRCLLYGKHKKNLTRFK